MSSPISLRGFRPPSTLLGCAALVAFLAGGCRPAPRPAELVLLGGRLVTLDPERPEAEALAAAGGEIVAVGSEEEVRRFIGSGTEVLDLDGHLAVPGFIEGHGHFLELGRQLTILDLYSARSWEGIVARVAQAARRSPEGAWIEGRGWHQEKWGSVPPGSVEGVPTHGELSAASPRHPVFLEHASGHAAFANARALERAEIGPATPDPPGGTIVRDASGRPTGLLRESAADLVEAALDRDRARRPASERQAELRRWARLAAEQALAHGVTTFHDAGATFGEVDLYRRLADEGTLPLRLYVLLWGENDELAAKLRRYRTVGSGGERLTVRGIKKQLDGALGSHGAWLLEPYADLPHTSGTVLDSLAEIRGAAELALEHGFQLAVHAIGDRANRELLDLFEEVTAGRDPDALRWRVEHAQHVSPADVPRFAALGVIASVQTIHGCSDAPWVAQRLGPERAASTGYLWRALWDSGVLVANGTDTPIEPVDPLAGIHCAVARSLPDGSVFFPGQEDQRLNRREALAAYTLNPARAAFEEERKGSLTRGKLADVVVLSDDILEIPAAEIPSARVLYTIVGGRVAWRARGMPEPALAQGSLKTAP